MKRLAALLILFASATASASFCGGYTNQRTLTVNAAAVSTQTLNYTNFPVLISTSEVTLSTTTGAGGHLVTGYDLIISSDSNCLFPVNFDTETVQNVGISTMNIWVKLDFSSSTNRTYYLTYGNAAITTYQGISSSATYDSNYKAVYHMNESTMAYGNLSYNSISGGANLFYYQQGTSNPAQPTPGITDGSSYLQSSNEYNGASSSSTANIGAGTGNITIEGWIKFHSASSGYDPGYNTPIDLSNFPDALSLVTYGNDAYVGARYQFFSGGAQDFATSTSNITTGTWYQYVIEYDGTTLSFYFNGAFNSSITVSHARSTDGPLFLSQNPDAQRTSDIILDELRVSNSLRSYGWIQTEYNNMTSPQTFVTIGPEQTSTTPAVNTNSIGLVINAGTLVINGVTATIR